MPVKTLLQHAVLAAAMLFIYAGTYRVAPFLSAILLLAYWYRKTRERSVIMLALLMLSMHIQIPSFLNDDTTMRVTEIHQNYSILKSGSEQYVYYHDGPMDIDSIILKEGDLIDIKQSGGFYSYSFADYLGRKGITKQLVKDELKTFRQLPTVRSWIQKRIESFPDPLQKSFLYKVLLNVTDPGLPEGFLLSGGFSYAGILLMINSILRLFISSETREKVMLAISGITGIIFRFPIILFMHFFSRILRFGKLSRYESTGILLIVTVLVYRQQVYTASFLFPAVFRLSALESEHKKLKAYACLMTLQSIMYNKISIFSSVLYPLTLRISGCLWLYGMVSLFVTALLNENTVNVISNFELIGSNISLKGSMIGCGLFFFVILVFLFRNSRNFTLYYIILLLVFELGGLFHPFAEVTFINVGQGDAILIREAFGKTNVLIDTGKPSAYKTLQATLDAKGIYRLDTLFITHADSDHSGNRESLLEDYRIVNLTDAHEGTSIAGSLVFHDLNTIKDEDENRSSLVLCMRLNGLDYLFMGDADQVTEEGIVRKIPKLSCDILKLSHHGSKTGSCDLFLDTVRPAEAIISAGSWGIYHHPSDETLQRLLKRHIPYLNTNEHGDITIVCIGPFNILMTSQRTIQLIR